MRKKIPLKFVPLEQHPDVDIPSTSTAIGPSKSITTPTPTTVQKRIELEIKNKQDDIDWDELDKLLEETKNDQPNNTIQDESIIVIPPSKPTVATAPKPILSTNAIPAPQRPTASIEEFRNRFNYEPIHKKTFVPRFPKEQTPPIDKNNAQYWIYPKNFGEIRQYQLQMVEKSLFDNTLICLPTGLGKTLIAAVCMLNFYRWFPSKNCKLVFMAPSRPLVTQQMEACYQIAGIPQEDMIELTGSVSTEKRIPLYKNKRVFFATPQTIRNDLEANALDPKQIVLVVIDEAHKAMGSFAYCKVVEAIYEVSDHCRVLALTATVPTKMNSVKQMIQNLKISHIEIKDETDPEVKRYTFHKDIEVISVDLGRELEEVRLKYLKLLEEPVKRLAKVKVLYTMDPGVLNYNIIFMTLRQFQIQHKSSDRGFASQSDLFLLLSMYRAYDLLTVHGLTFFTNALEEMQQECKDSKKVFGKAALVRNPLFTDLLKTCKRHVQNGVIHPKLNKLDEIICNHLRNNSSSRIIVFAQYRETVEKIFETLSKHAPLTKCMLFVGQANSKGGSKGLNQKEQKKILQEFRSNNYNILISTSVGEEGLDIGECDLIVCYDALTSPIRMIQRIGRTGRKKEGFAVILVSKGNEEDSYVQSMEKGKKFYSYIRSQLQHKGSSSLQLYENNNRIVPDSIQPKLKYEEIQMMPLLREDLDPLQQQQLQHSKEVISNIELQYLKQHYGTFIPPSASEFKSALTSLCITEDQILNQGYLDPYYLIHHSSKTRAFVKSISYVNAGRFNLEYEQPNTSKEEVQQDTILDMSTTIDLDDIGTNDLRKFEESFGGEDVYQEEEEIQEEYMDRPILEQNFVEDEFGNVTNHHLQSQEETNYFEEQPVHEEQIENVPMDVVEALHEEEKTTAVERKEGIIEELILDVPCFGVLPKIASGEFKRPSYNYNAIDEFIQQVTSLHRLILERKKKEPPQKSIDSLLLKQNINTPKRSIYDTSVPLEPISEAENSAVEPSLKRQKTLPQSEESSKPVEEPKPVDVILIEEETAKPATSHVEKTDQVIELEDEDVVLIDSPAEKKIPTQLLTPKVALEKATMHSFSQEHFTKKRTSVEEKSTQEYKCFTCGKAFATLNEVDAHFDDMHGIDESYQSPPKDVPKNREAFVPPQSPVKQNESESNKSQKQPKHQQIRVSQFFDQEAVVEDGDIDDDLDLNSVSEMNDSFIKDDASSETSSTNMRAIYFQSLNQSNNNKDTKWKSRFDKYLS